MKAIQNGSLIELNIEDMSQVNGGTMEIAIAVMSVCIYVYNNWGDFRSGLREGFRPY